MRSECESYDKNLLSSVTSRQPMSSHQVIPEADKIMESDKILENSNTNSDLAGDTVHISVEVTKPGSTLICIAEQSPEQRPGSSFDEPPLV
jgi:hypothetical protein